MIHFSSWLQNAWLATNSLQQLLNSGTIYVYSGPVPANADAAIDASSVLLATVKNGASGVTFSNTPTNGVLQKTASETWSGSVAATGNATFYRYCVGSDTGSGGSASGNYRVQGSIGTDASFDLVVGSAALTSGGTFPINTYQLAITQ